MRNCATGPPFRFISETPENLSHSVLSPSILPHSFIHQPIDDADEFTYAQNLLFLIALSIFFRAIAYVAVLKRGPVFDTSL